MDVLDFLMGERVDRTGARLLRTELLGELVVIGVSGQILELSGYLLLFCLLSSGPI